MTSRYQRSFKSLAMLVVLAIMNVYVATAWAAPGVPSMQAVGKITTSGNQPVTVNGNSVGSGGSIQTGATIETPDGVGATINLGPLGSIDLPPNSSVTIEFTGDSIKVTVHRGCAVVRNKQGTTATVTSDDGQNDSSDNSGKKSASVCYPGASAANAGAGGGGGGAAAGGAAAGIGTGVIIALIGAAAGAVVIAAVVANSGDATGNPSGSNP